MHRELRIMSGYGPTAMLEATNALATLPKWLVMTATLNSSCCCCLAVAAALTTAAAASAALPMWKTCRFCFPVLRWQMQLLHLLLSIEAFAWLEHEIMNPHMRWCMVLMHCAAKYAIYTVIFLLMHLKLFVVFLLLLVTFQLLLRCCVCRQCQQPLFHAARASKSLRLLLHVTIHIPIMLREACLLTRDS